MVKKKGIALRYKVEGSNNGETWNLLSDGEFSNIRSNPIEQVIRFGKPVGHRYIRFVPTDVVGDTFSVAEFGLLQ